MIEIMNNTRAIEKSLRLLGRDLGSTLALRLGAGDRDKTNALRAILDGYVAERMLGDEPEVDVRLTFLADFMAVGEDQLRELVAEARLQGRNWAQIGMALGMTRQGARQRFGTRA